MAAPEYLIKLKFGTEIDQGKFQELQQAYQKLTDKQKRAFAKAYNTEISDMNKLFMKETTSNLEKYEKAAIKTEKTLTATRVKELRDFINKRNQQLQRLPGYTAGALAASGLLIANSYVNNTMGMTQFEKNTTTGVLNKGAAGATAGAMVAGIPGAIVGGVVGAATGWITAEFENTAQAFSRSAELFSTAVNTYKNLINQTAGVQGEMHAAGFDDPAEYMAYRQALKTMDIDNDAFIDMVARSLMGSKNSGLAQLGQDLIGARRDVAMQTMWDLFQKEHARTGISAREFAMNSQEKGGLGLSRFAAANAVTLFQGKSPQQAVNEVLSYLPKDASGKSVSAFTPAIEESRRKRIDLDNREWASMMDNFRTISEIDMNKDIVEEGDRMFARHVKLMQESTILLAGINEKYKIYEKDLAEIFSRITSKTGVGTSYARSMSGALQRGMDAGIGSDEWNDAMTMIANGTTSMTINKPLMSRISDAERSISQTRYENMSTPINGH